MSKIGRFLNSLDRAVYRFFSSPAGAWAVVVALFLASSACVVATVVITVVLVAR